MENRDTAEYRAFQGCFDRLVTGVKNDAESVARKAFTNNLISSDSLSNATNQTCDEPYRATKLLVNILARIQQNPACFDRFVTILKSIPIMEELAQQLISEYEHTNKLPKASVKSPTHSLSTGALGGIHDPQRSTSIADLEEMFNTLVSQCTKTHEINPRALANIILCMNLFDSESDLDESLVADCQTDLQQASSNAAIFEIVKPYMSFLNPELLGHIIEFLGTDQDRKCFKRFMISLEEYCRVTEVKLLPNQLDEIPISEMAFHQVHVVMERLTMSLESVQNLQSKMAKVFKLNVAGLQVELVSKSPLTCSFQLPNFAYKKVFPLSNKQQREIKALGLTSLKCGEHMYTCNSHTQVSDEAELEIPCLGRPFRLGMFYDCRNDNLLLGGIQLCNDDVIQPLVEEIPQVSHNCEVLEDDSMETKALSLQLTPALKLSLMSNLIQNVSKSAKYWNDYRKAKRQVRVSLKYTSTVVKKQLPLDRLSEIQQSIFENATHVVTGVLYGVDAYCVFDSTLRENERFEDIQESLLTMVKTLSCSDNAQKSIPSDSNCKVYSDSEHLYSLQESIIYFQKQQDRYHSPDDKVTPIPQKVWMYPLKRLNNQCSIVARTVSIGVVDKLQTTLEYLHHIQILANDLLNEHSVTFSRFQHTENRVTKFTEIVTTYRNELQKSIAELLPQVRGGTVDESKLAKIIEKSSTSPFRYESLIAWLKQVKEEIGTLEMLTNQVKDTEFMTLRELESVTSKDSDYIVCFEFHVALEDDQTLSYFQSYQQSKEMKQSPSDTQQWYTNPELMKKITSTIEHFKAFMESNSRNKNTEFTITNHKLRIQSTAAPQLSDPTSIYLYEGTSCKPWEPPGPPGKPTVKEVTHNTVQLHWSGPKYGCQSVECYQVSYYSVDQPQDDHDLTTSSAQPVATISGLAASTKYVFTVQSKCKVGLGAKGETSDPVETKVAPPTLNQNEAVSTESKQGVPNNALPMSANKSQSQQAFSNKPTATAAITHNSITLEWALPEENSENVDSYTIMYREMNSKKWKRQTSEQSSYLFTGLQAETKYIFKVRPELDDGNVGDWSEVSDPIETKAPICQPGKPIASAVTHDRITIQWDKPEYNNENVEAYRIRYRSVNDPSKRWKSKTSESNNTNLSIADLSPQMKYIFKVRPELEDGSAGIESEESDPIETKAQLNAGLGKPSFTEVTNETVTIKWKIPEIESESYTVSYRSVDKKQWKSINIDASQENATVRGLSSDTNYIFKVRSECASGDGPSSELSDPIKTRATSPPGKPTASDVTHNSVLLKWSKPKHGSENIKQYKLLLYSHCIMCADSHEPEALKELLTESSQEHMLIGGLSVNTAYMFQVQPICSELNLGCTSAISEAIETKPTSPPGKPQAKNITHNSIILEWTKPEYGNEGVNCYIITVECEDSTPNDLKTEGAQETITVSHLDMKKKYKFKVYPECGEAGVGMESEMSDVIETMATSPPGKPTVCETETTHESVHLKWTEPEEKCEDIKGYEIWYRKTHTNDWKTVESSGPNLYKTIINQKSMDTSSTKNIDYNSEYVFKVIPKCINGKGCGSEISDPVRTKTTTPPGRPRAHSQTHNSVKLEWTKPKQRGDLKNIRYTIVYKDKKRDIESEKEAIPESSECTKDQMSTSIGGLTSDTEYIFKVQPHCPTGPGAESEWSEPIRTKIVYYKPGKPTDKTPTTYDKIHLEWTRPEHGWRQVQCYSVHYCKADDSNWRESVSSLTSQQNVLEYTVSELLPGTSYIFKVKSHLLVPPGNHSHTEEESESSNPIQTKTTTPPGKPKVVDRSYKSIKLEWSYPDKTSSHIDYYIITCEKLQKSYQRKKITKKVTSETITATVEGLESKTQYTLKVIPHCDHPVGHGNGEPSESITVETLASCKPGPPICVTSTHHSITLKWKKPQYHSGKVQRYNLSFRSQHDSRGHHEVSAKHHDKNHSVEIQGLTHNTEYTFTVLPICEPASVGTEPSVSEPIVTMATSPPGKPIKSQKIETHDGITLQWTKPNIGSENIKHYEVMYKKCTMLSSQSFIKTKTDTNQENKTVMGLTYGTNYIFKVQAICSTGTEDKDNKGMESDVSDPIETNKTSPPGKPTAVTCTHNTVTLEWRKPDFGSTIVDRYTIYFSKDGKQWNIVPKSTERQKPTLSTPNITCTVQELETRTSYYFRVLPVCKSSSGSTSETSEQIKTNATGPPTKPTYRNVTHNTIHVYWEPPKLGQDRIDHYQLSYRKFTKGGSKKIVNFKVEGGKTPNYCVESLEKNTKYTFNILPICKDDLDKGTESAESDVIMTKATSPPGKPWATEVTHNSIQLKWTKPDDGVPDKYEIRCYRKETISTPSYALDSKRSRGVSSKESFEVDSLQPETSYCFQIYPICGIDYGTESRSDEIITKPVCEPTEFKASNTTHESTTLTWTRPVRGTDQITHYTVYFKKANDSDWLKRRTKCDENKVTIEKLNNCTQYTFKVCPELSNTCNRDLSVDFSNEIQVTTKSVPLAICKHKEAQSKNLQLREGPPSVYELPGVTYTMRDDEMMIAKCHFGNPKLGRGKRERVLMLVGSTGEGKSTLIECMVNFILGVKWKYHFRFQLIKQETRSKAESQTRFITAYTFYPVEGSALEYTLTIIDTPGFGDTRGIQHDVALTKQIKQFFLTNPPEGIDHIDGVGFVVKAASPRLTLTQRYIFDSILGVFGRDMEHNIFLMVTFCDAGDPEVLEAIKIAKVPMVDYFKFNNSALYAKNNTSDIINYSFWKMGIETLSYFFGKFEKMEPRTLQLTQATLEERDQLETLVEGLQRQITASLELIREVQQDKDAITAHRLNVNSNTPFEYEVEVMKGFEEPLPHKGKKVTVCLKCNFTCHYPCTIKNDNKKYKCFAMEGSYWSRNTDSHCIMCPRKCHWSIHFNKPYLYVLRPVTEKRTLDDLIKKYSKPESSGEQTNTAEIMLSGVAKKLKETYDEVLRLIENTQESINKLDRIALRKFASSKEGSSRVAYIDVLIEGEMSGKNPGYGQRIEALKLLKDKAQVEAEVAKSMH